MITLALTFSTTGLYYVVLTGTKAQPVLQEKNKIVLPANHTVPQMASWFENQIDLLLNRINPDIVSYKLSISRVTNSMVQKSYYGQAILNLLCHKRGIDVSHVSPSSIVVSKYGLAKGVDLHKYIDQQVGTHPPHWDSNMRDTALIALIFLA